MLILSTNLDEAVIGEFVLIALVGIAMVVGGLCMSSRRKRGPSPSMMLVQRHQTRLVQVDIQVNEGNRMLLDSPSRLIERFCYLLRRP